MGHRLGELETDPAGWWHRLACVDHEVHDHLLELSPIALDAADFSALADEELDVLSDQPPQDGFDALHDRGQLQDTPAEDLLATERQELLGERASAPLGVVDELQVSPRRVVRLELASNQMDAPRDDRHDVVEVKIGR